MSLEEKTLVTFYSLYEKAYTLRPVGFHHETEEYSIDRHHGYYATVDLANDVAAKIKESSISQGLRPKGIWEFLVYPHTVEKSRLIEEAPGIYSYGRAVIRTKPLW